MKRVLLFVMMAVSLMAGCGQQEPVEAVFGPFDGVTGLQIEIGAAEVRIVAGDAVLVETDNPYVSAEVSRGVLRIREENHGADLKSSEITLCLPEDLVLDRMDLEAGAGEITAQALQCGSLELELGAGSVEFAELAVIGLAELDGGAGEIRILGGSVGDLELEIGAGEADVEVMLHGGAELSVGVGSLRMRIREQTMEDYTIRMEQGLGQILLNGERYTGSTTVGDGPERIRIEGGIGSVEIDFMR